ncbi:helix-turn-helix domain-containing protein [Pseudoxanthobacter soli]|uniref:helix-turn-helix domain-containing protein n=1 Tax=Pseudoxanthobacter soli TaxID=433840 RepID=UPI00093573AB|nr:helix-turn-helix transcriptional regulator [Pseudoxanthobacter soli]
MNALAEYLKRQRIKRREFAALIDVSPSYVTALCTGTCWPSRDVALRIRQATGGAVTPDAFLAPPDPVAMPDNSPAGAASAGGGLSAGMAP